MKKNKIYAVFLNLKSQTEERDFLSACSFSGTRWGARARPRAS